MSSSNHPQHSSCNRSDLSPFWTRHPEMPLIPPGDLGTCRSVEPQRLGWTRRGDERKQPAMVEKDGKGKIQELGGGFKHFFSTPTWGNDPNISKLTNIFEMGWNHQLEEGVFRWKLVVLFLLFVVKGCCLLGVVCALLETNGPNSGALRAANLTHQRWSPQKCMMPCVRCVFFLHFPTEDVSKICQYSGF